MTILDHLAPTSRSLGAVCVLGMHRSGTSALSGCLEGHGLFLGDVVRAAPYNRRGNNENLEIRELHDQVLADSGGEWDHPPAAVEWRRERRVKLRQIIAGFASQGRWGFKDPRTLLTLDAWLEEIPDLTLVGTFRHPRCVVDSLIARQPSFRPDHALELWMTYNTRLLNLVTNRGALTVCFDLPTEQYVGTVRQLGRAIGLGDATLEYFTPQLRHWDSNGRWQGIPNEARALYQELRARSIIPQQTC